MTALIYHGTPMTPRAALLNVCASRAMCVSYFRPDDVEAVAAISPAIMFRQWCLFRMARGSKARAGMVHPRGLDALLRLARTASVSSWTLGSDPRRAWRAKPAQRQPFAAVAVRATRRASLAHGRADRASVAAVRAIRTGLSGMDGRGQAPGRAGLPRPHGGSGPRSRKPLACLAHDARHSSCADVSLHQRGRHHTGAERVAL